MIYCAADEKVGAEFASEERGSRERDLTGAGHLSTVVIEERGAVQREEDDVRVHEPQIDRAQRLEEWRGHLGESAARGERIKQRRAGDQDQQARAVVRHTHESAAGDRAERVVERRGQRHVVVDVNRRRVQVRADHDILDALAFPVAAHRVTCAVAEAVELANACHAHELGGRRVRRVLRVRGRVGVVRRGEATDQLLTVRARIEILERTERKWIRCLN